MRQGRGRFKGRDGEEKMRDTERKVGMEAVSKGNRRTEEEVE